MPVFIKLRKPPILNAFINGSGAQMGAGWGFESICKLPLASEAQVLQLVNPIVKKSSSISLSSKKNNLKVDYLKDIVEQIELHSVEGITNCFQHGVHPNDLFRDQPLIYELTSEYTRSPRFKDCVRVFVDHGLQFEDELLLSVLLDEADVLGNQLQKDPSAVNKKYTLRSAYTPMFEVSLLHICAEFNHVRSAEILINFGADMNARAGIDEHGFGGQTPVFHTVNQNSNESKDMLNFLLGKSVDLLVTVPGLIWGKGYEWETLIPAVNPISYAMMGLLPQMHRKELTISNTVSQLLIAAYGIDYRSPNVPCKYLRH